MDPIHPIAPGPPAIPRTAVPPVGRLPKVSREGDRPAADSEQRRRRRREEQPSRYDDGEDDGRPRIDVRV